MTPKQIKKIPLPTNKINFVVKTGGYYRWGWRFPFRHWIDECVYIASDTEVVYFTNAHTKENNK